MDHIKNLLEGFLKKNEIGKEDAGGVIFDKWDAVAGMLAKGTKPFKYDKKKLFIYAENSVIMSEITYKKRALMKKINNYFRKETVTEIICRMRQ